MPQALGEIVQRCLMRDPAKLVQAQIGFWQDYMTLWQNTTRRMWGMNSDPVIQADPKDKQAKRMYRQFRQRRRQE